MDEIWKDIYYVDIITDEIIRKYQIFITGITTLFTHIFQENLKVKILMNIKGIYGILTVIIIR